MTQRPGSATEAGGLGGTLDDLSGQPQVRAGPTHQLTGVTLDVLPDVLSGREQQHFIVRTGTVTVTGPMVVLISDNPYGTGNDVPQRAIPVALDGESTLVEAPVGCHVRSGSLRVPRERPGAALLGQLVALPWLAR